MENIAQKLRKAYDLIATANTNDIDAYMLAVEEAHGFIAEALDICDSPERERTFVDDGKTKFYLDDDEVSCEKFNDFFNAHDVGWGEWTDEQGTNHVVIYTDDAN